MIRVECYSGYKADQRPVRVAVGGTLLEIEQVEDRWYSPGVSFFRVVVHGGDRYVLRHDEAQDVWSIEGFRAASLA